MREQLGVFYDKTSDFQQEQFVTFSRHIRNVIAIETIKSLLDVGAGSGARTMQAFDLFPMLKSITAFDPDFEMVEAAEKNYPRDGVTYRRASAETLPDFVGTEECWSRWGFDAAISNWAVHWIPDKDKFLDGLEQLVAPNGYFMFSTCERLPKILVDVDNYIKQEFRIQGAPSPFFYLDKNQWIALLEARGWEIVKAVATPIAHEVQSAEQYLSHWFTASATKFMYGKHLVELSDISRSDLLLFMQRSYPSQANKDGLVFNEDGLFIIARKR